MLPRAGKTWKMGYLVYIARENHWSNKYVYEYKQQWVDVSEPAAELLSKAFNLFEIYSICWSFCIFFIFLFFFFSFHWNSKVFSVATIVHGMPQNPKKTLIHIGKTAEFNTNTEVFAAFQSSHIRELEKP